MSHQHSHATVDQPHQIIIRNKLTSAFLQLMHDTELWASHIPRVPLGLYLLAFIGLALGAASFTSSMPDSALLKFATLILGVLLIVPFVLAYRFAQRKWKYASNIRQEIFDSLSLYGGEKVLDVACGSGHILCKGVQAGVPHGVFH